MQLPLDQTATTSIWDIQEQPNQDFEHQVQNKEAQTLWLFPELALPLQGCVPAWEYPYAENWLWPLHC